MNTKLAGLLLILLVVATVSACASTLPRRQVSAALPATPSGAASSAEIPVPAATATQDETPVSPLAVSVSPLVLPTVIPSATSAAVKPNAAWLSYHHAPMGLTLEYPAEWRLETLEMAGLVPILEELTKDPEANVDVEGTLTFGNQIKLYASTFEKAPLDVVLIGLEAYRIAEEDDLLTLVNLVNEANRLTSPTLESPPMTITRPTLEGVDDMVVVSVEQGDWRSEAIYLAKDGLMFVVATASRDPGVVETMHAMVRSFVFDGSTQALFEQYRRYTVDADVLRASIQSLTPKPQPECDIVCRDAKAMAELAALNPPVSPLAPVSPLSPLAAPNPPLRLPTPTPEPRISPFPPGYYEQDPGVWDENGVYPPFSITYDPAHWTLVLPGNGNGGDRLENRLILGCWLHIGYGPMDAYLVEEKQLGGYQWKIYRMPPDGNAFAYRLNIAYDFGPVLPGNATEAERQQCIQMTEDVISTFRLLPLATPAPE